MPRSPAFRHATKTPHGLIDLVPKQEELKKRGIPWPVFSVLPTDPLLSFSTSLLHCKAPQTRGLLPLVSPNLILGGEGGTPP